MFGTYNGRLFQIITNVCLGTQSYTTSFLAKFTFVNRTNKYAPMYGEFNNHVKSMANEKKDICL